MDVNNVPFGDADARVGNRGLANLDMTTLPKQEGSLTGADLRMMRLVRFSRSSG